LLAVFWMLVNIKNAHVLFSKPLFIVDTLGPQKPY
jgi:hypothetical protein